MAAWVHIANYTHTGTPFFVETSCVDKRRSGDSCVPVGQQVGMKRYFPAPTAAAWRHCVALQTRKRAHTYIL